MSSGPISSRGRAVAILHEVLLVIGVALVLVVALSLATLGREYAQTGRISLAILEQGAACEGTACSGPAQGRRIAPPQRF